MQPLPATLARDLSRAAAYPHDADARAGVGRGVEWVQTHLSHVYLTRERVYKLRKSVDLGFVDFSTRAQRNHDCLREVALNRRLAEHVYLGVAPVERGRGGFRVGALDARAQRLDPAREHVVVMRRLPAGCDAPSMLARGAFRNPHIDAVALRLARFHADHGLGRPSPWSRAAWFARVQAPVLENLRLLEAGAGRFYPRETWANLRARAGAFALAQRAAFEARRVAGRAVDGHGDVHLQHVWFEPGRSEPTLIDCIEFNDDLRRIDAAAEVAFLAMDLIYRRRSRLADRFLRVYAGCADDFELYRVVDYFLSYRAAVRAKVAAIAADDPAIDAAQRKAAADSARRHLALALRFLAPRPLGGVVVMAGVVGTGKSTAAEVVADALGGVVIASDLVRKRLHGMSATDRSGAAKGLYSQAARDRVYAAILERAAAVVDAGRIAVLDATYARTQQRDAVLRFAAQRGVPVWIVETRARRATALARRALRQSRGDSASDAGPARYAASVAEFEAFRLPRGVRRQIVRTDAAGWKLALRRAARVWSTPA
jgi:aminoglycoside phosphotransferase family enzyme/predicted kinase